MGICWPSTKWKTSISAAPAAATWSSATALKSYRRASTLRRPEMEHPEASREQVALAEEVIRADFQAALDDLLRQRGLTKPLSTDDRAIWGFADAAVRRYHDATADDPGLPQLSKVQLWEIRQRLYLMHGPLGPHGDLLAIDEVEDIHISGARGGYLVFGDRLEELPAGFDSAEA